MCLGLALRGLHAWQESGGAIILVVSLKASGAEKLAEIYALESHELECLHDNQGLDEQLVVFKVDEEFMRLPDVESTKAITDDNVELANAKEAFGVLGSRAPEIRLIMWSAIKGLDGVHQELGTPSGKLQVSKKGGYCHI